MQQPASGRGQAKWRSAAAGTRGHVLSVHKIATSTEEETYDPSYLAAGGSDASCQLGSSAPPVDARCGMPASRLPALALAVQLAPVRVPPSSSPRQQASAAAARASSVPPLAPIRRCRLRWPASLSAGDGGALLAVVSSAGVALLQRSGWWKPEHPAWAAGGAVGAFTMDLEVCRQMGGFLRDP